MRSFQSLLCVALLLVGVVAVLARLGDAQYDFAIDYASAKAVVSGENPYVDANELIARHIPNFDLNREAQWPNWKPPFRLLMAVPLLPLPFDVAASVWITVDALALVVAMMFFTDALGWPRLRSIAIGAGALTLPITQADLSLGQVNGVLLLLLVVAWRLLRSERSIASGWVLGALTAFKVFPAFLFLPLARKSRATVVVGLLTASALTAVSALIIGIGRTVDFVHAAFGGYGPYRSADFNVSLMARFGPVGLVLALPLVVFGLRPFARRTQDAYWAAVPVMLLTFPIVWEHYLVLMLPWIALAWVRRPQRWLIIPSALITIPAIGSGHAWLMTLGLLLAVLYDADVTRERLSPRVAEA